MNLTLVVVRAMALSLCVAATACGGSGSSEKSGSGSQEDLGDFFARHIEYELKGQYGRSWDELHPGQQQIVARDQYVDCRDQVDDQLAGVGLDSLDVTEVYDDPISSMGVTETTSKAVTMEITMTDGSNEESYTDTFHAIPREGHWVWLLPDSDLSDYEDDVCPT